MHRMTYSRLLIHPILVSMSILSVVGMSPLSNALEDAKSPSSPELRDLQVDAEAQLQKLLKEVDADDDRKITILDLNSPRSKQTKSKYSLEDIMQQHYEVSGIYFLSNLLQELKLAIDARAPQTRGTTMARLPDTIRGARIFENPVKRISRMIRENYWQGLTRRIDSEHLEELLPDSKLPTRQSFHLYVPKDDPMALEYFSKAISEHPNLKIELHPLGKREQLGASPSTRMAQKPAHGLLTLALDRLESGQIIGVPFVVPGGRFNEMYGWDSFFEAIGLLADGRVDLARAMVDNFIYEIQHYGKILNANRSYYLNRSQPPFLTSMIRAVYDQLRANNESKKWLRGALQAAITEYEEVWQSSERRTELGLNHYAGSGHGIPPEVEKGHFNFILAPAAKRHRTSIAKLQSDYEVGKLKDPELDEFFAQDRAVRESGHDTTYRWRVNGVDRAADFVTVDLNSLLLKYEFDIALLIRTEFNDNFVRDDGKPSMKSHEWLARAGSRKAAMLKFLWDAKESLFFDYDYRKKERSHYVSATAFYPFWIRDEKEPLTQVMDRESALKSMKKLTLELEQAGGLAATSQTSLQNFGDSTHARQWEYPNGWAPHQMLAWAALRTYGDQSSADRLTYKWLYMITRNAVDFNGTIPEKFDVVHRSHAVFAEYGNVGTKFSYITKEGFGWMNASYQVGLRNLAAKWRGPLEELKPPEWLQFEEAPPSDALNTN